MTKTFGVKGNLRLSPSSNKKVNVFSKSSSEEWLMTNFNNGDF